MHCGGWVSCAMRSGTGPRLHSGLFHDAYHPFAEALWQLRSGIRVDLGSAALTPADLDKPGWDDQANCDFCQAPASLRPDPGARGA